MSSPSPTESTTAAETATTDDRAEALVALRDKYRNRAVETGYDIDFKRVVVVWPPTNSICGSM